LLTDFCQVALTVNEDKSVSHTQLQTVADDLQSAANSQLQVLYINSVNVLCFLSLLNITYGIADKSGA